ncbi:unnamed protein product [Blepharisma stoltei]|uniref:Uncharacterized protein n=1 Tax=Blepharisma stoltei TaxID=1481888 RepID=A0AAU9JIX7_9CILI|nr:unnamed protein product [Blepharisma stoltei]
MANIEITKQQTTQNDSEPSRFSARKSSASPKRRIIYPPMYKILESPNLKATLTKHLQRIPNGSSALPRDQKRLEGGWNDRFCYTFSKDNKNYPTKLREYFDSPKDFEQDNKDSFIPNVFLNTTGRIQKRSHSIVSSEKKNSNGFKNYQGKKKQRGLSMTNGKEEWKDLSTHNADRNLSRYKTFRAYFDDINKII